jgi:16S rRNA (uracil1498-N3)-methyltransferase
MTDYIKLPRLYVDHELTAGHIVTFGEDQAHYLRAVLRQNPGDRVRVFNGRDGEYLCTLDSVGKKAVTGTASDQLFTQPATPVALHLYFAPIKKARMDMLIEKAVELGATHLHPVLTQNTEVRNINAGRVRAQIIEASEQCERLDVPVLAPAATLSALITPAAPLYACIERAADAPALATALQPGPAAVLIGPEGGFSTAEAESLRQRPDIKCVSLGPRTLRSETAAFAALVTVQNAR